MAAKVWAIGAGKGGVGKTFITSSLGITLSKFNHSVLLIDFDSSGANLHTCFGLKLSDRNLRSYFSGNKTRLADLIQGTDVPRVSMIQGFWDSWSSNEFTVEQINKFVFDCKSMPYDYVLVDLGAGASVTNLEIFRHADEKILISNPEPTTVEKTYRFIEAFLCSEIKDNATAEAKLNLESTLRKYREQYHAQPFSFRTFLKSSNGFSFDYFDGFGKSPIRLIINSTRSQPDQNLGYSIKSVCNKYYDLSLDYVGGIDFDNAVWQSIKVRRPFLLEKPFTPLAGQFLSITKYLVAPDSGANYFKAAV